MTQQTHAWELGTTKRDGDSAINVEAEPSNHHCHPIGLDRGRERLRGGLSTAWKVYRRFGSTSCLVAARSLYPSCEIFHVVHPAQGRIFFDSATAHLLFISPRRILWHNGLSCSMQNNHLLFFFFLHTILINLGFLGFFPNWVAEQMHRG